MTFSYAHLQVAAALRLERSLFERIQAAAPACVKLLSVQYRMHPMIRQFPSKVSSWGQLVYSFPLRIRDEDLAKEAEWRCVNNL